MILGMSITNFKSFRKAIVPFGAFTVIVGANATGKSNVRDALGFLRAVAAGIPISEAVFGRVTPTGHREWRGVRGGWSEFSNDPKLNTGFHVRVGNESNMEPFDYVMYLEPQSTTAEPELAGELIAHREEPLYVAEALPDLEDGPSFIWTGTVRESALGKRLKTKHYNKKYATLTQVPERPEEDEAIRKACSRIIKEVEAIHFLDLDPHTMREPSPPGARRLGDRGENLSTVLQAIAAEEGGKRRLISWLRALTPMDATDVTFKTDLTGKVLAFLIEASGRQTSLYSASDGTLRFLGILAALFGPERSSMYFIEEIDTGIHPARVHLLLDLIEQSCENDGIQVVVTTHNPSLLAALSLKAISSAVLAYRPPGAPETRLRTIASLPNIGTVLEHTDLGELHASGWLETAAAFADGIEDDDDASPPPVAEPGPSEGS